VTGAPAPAAVLFDMDGTLIDSEGLWLQAEQALMTRLGSTWSEADQRHCLGGPLERVADYMVARSGTDLTPEAVGGMLLDEVEARFRAEPVRWRPGARALLTDARNDGIPTALVSASWNRLIDTVRSRIDAEVGRSAFDVVVAGDDVDEGKPHPEPYLTAAVRLGVDPTQCLALEDSPTGVTSAAAAGCRVVAIQHIAVIDHPGVRVIGTLVGESIASLWQQAAE
jgi:HAD superfamily hydrolase (TIGR01509 family)